LLYRNLIVVLVFTYSCVALSTMTLSSEASPTDVPRKPPSEGESRPQESAKPANSSLNEAQRKLLRLFRSEFVAVVPGSFQRGSADGRENERPLTTVTLKKPFHMAAYEVPQNLWQAVLGTDPSRWKGPRNSVELLTFAEAVEFCVKATSMMRSTGLIQEDEIIRLPSEAEWEYCARAGTTTRYSFGDAIAKLDDHAWSTRNAAGNDPPVGARKPNPWKLYDVHGYLWEWCLDSWSDDYEGAPTDGSPRVDEDAASGVLRGGSWKDQAEKLTSSYRRQAPRETRGDEIGLRCVLAKVSDD